MVTPRRRIASPSFTGVVADRTPVANPGPDLPTCGLTSPDAGLARPQNRTRPVTALVWPHVGT
jgi:hypothetical protein